MLMPYPTITLVKPMIVKLPDFLQMNRLDIQMKLEAARGNPALQNTQTLSMMVSCTGFGTNIMAIAFTAISSIPRWKFTCTELIFLKVLVSTMAQAHPTVMARNSMATSIFISNEHSIYLNSEWSSSGMPNYLQIRWELIASIIPTLEMTIPIFSRLCISVQCIKQSRMKTMIGPALEIVQTMGTYRYWKEIANRKPCTVIMLFRRVSLYRSGRQGKCSGVPQIQDRMQEIRKHAKPRTRPMQMELIRGSQVPRSKPSIHIPFEMKIRMQAVQSAPISDFDAQRSSIWVPIEILLKIQFRSDRSCNYSSIILSSDPKILMLLLSTTTIQKQRRKQNSHSILCSAIGESAVQLPMMCRRVAIQQQPVVAFDTFSLLTHSIGQQFHLQVIIHFFIRKLFLFFLHARIQSIIFVV